MPENLTWRRVPRVGYAYTLAAIIIGLLLAAAAVWVWCQTLPPLERYYTWTYLRLGFQAHLPAAPRNLNRFAAGYDIPAPEHLQWSAGPLLLPARAGCRRLLPAARFVHRHGPRCETVKRFPEGEEAPRLGDPDASPVQSPNPRRRLCPSDRGVRDSSDSGGRMSASTS